MMSFTDKVLFLMPKAEDFLTASYQYKKEMFKAISNFQTYVDNVMYADSCILSTDEIYNSVDELDYLKPIGVLMPEDIFFAANNCDNAIKLDVPFVYPDLIGELRKKYPVVPGLTPTSRIEIVNKREKFIERKIIANAKCVITFDDRKKKKYNPQINILGNRLVFIVDRISFKLNVYYSGEQIPIDSVIKTDYALTPLTKWSVYG